LPLSIKLISSRIGVTSQPTRIARRRGILIKARSVASIRSILKSGLDRAFLDETSDHQPLRHGNIRGQGYFH